MLFLGSFFYLNLFIFIETQQTFMAFIKYFRFHLNIVAVKITFKMVCFAK